ncbi:10861_t:CDS:2 [Entrophospora sp. SA101]|nr:2746_t:CDS:2 [Entrophospora sp. SA101]CAJ0758799.1 10861_t:CDS:2 [Entrophospora sp. SA101]CAJ0824832.1 17022_t:CDS:2 [Entrophospora sp. SA101]
MSKVVDKNLSFELGEELNYHVKDSLSNIEKISIDHFIWDLQDHRGHNEVVLSRKPGDDEKIRLVFNILSTDSLNDDDTFNSIKTNQKENTIENVNVNKGVKYDLNEEQRQNIEKLKGPIRCVITIEKKNKSVLAFETIVQQDKFLLEIITYYENHKSNHGIKYINLNKDLRLSFKKYLKIYGINKNLAIFITKYYRYKEDQEYIEWLENLKAFVDN